MPKNLHYPDTNKIDQLPDDVLQLILSNLTTLAETARTSILSQRWRNVWHHITCLDFDFLTVLPRESVAKSHDKYIAWVNKVIEASLALPGSPSVRELRIVYHLDASQGQHIDRWVDFAISKRVEKLHLQLGGYGWVIYPVDQYKLSEEAWYRAPSGLTNIKCLRSLTLSRVNVSTQFIEFILSSCPLLEHLTLDKAGQYEGLAVSGAVLRQLKIDTLTGFALSKLCAPSLTSLYYFGTKFNPEKIDVPMLTDLTVGGRIHSPPIVEYLDYFWSYLPQLERLELKMQEEQRLLWREKIPTLAKLKYFKICADWDTDPIFFQIIRFMKECPLLETFVLEMFSTGKTRRSPRSIQQNKKWHEVENECSFECLKVMELYGADGNTIDQELVKCVLRNAPCLEKFLVFTQYPSYFNRPTKIKFVKAAQEKVKKLCQLASLEIETTVVG